MGDLKGLGLESRVYLGYQVLVAPLAPSTRGYINS